MKVKIGKYKDFFGPFQLAEAVCFWAKAALDEEGFRQKPGYVQKLGEFFAYGNIAPEAEDEVGVPRKLFIEREHSWLYRFLVWVNEVRGERTVKVRIDPSDTWSMDSTLSIIIVPLLKQLKDAKHGAPAIEDADVPEELKSTSATSKENEWDIDENYSKRWDWAINEMIHAFECCKDDSWEAQFFSRDGDGYVVKREDGTYEVNSGNYKIDKEGLEKANVRIENGLRLFGKYYRGLWD